MIKKYIIDQLDSFDPLHCPHFLPAELVPDYFAKGFDFRQRRRAGRRDWAASAAFRLANFAAAQIASKNLYTSPSFRATMKNV